MLPEAPNPVVLQLAEAFGREYVEKRPEFRNFARLYDAVHARTRDPKASADLPEVLLDMDERTIRRKVSELRELLEETARRDKLTNILSIEEARSGRHSEEVKLRRNTFILKPHLELPGFYLRKWWTGLFPNMPGLRALPVSILYPTVDAVKGRILAAQGDWQVVKHFSRIFWVNGIACDDQDAGSFTADPDEAERNLVLVGNSDSNHVISQVTFPEELVWRTHPDCAITDGGKVRWQDGESGAPRTVYALVSTFASRWNRKSRLWMFEARHDRALEAVARYFAEPENLEDLAGALNMSPTDEFPAALQLVFSVDVNRQNQLIGGTGNVQLVEASHRIAPRGEDPAGPAMRLPAGVQERKVLPMKARRGA